MFSIRTLPSNVPSVPDVQDDNEESEDNYIHAGDQLFKDENNYIQIKPEQLKITDLNENDFVITSLETSFFVAVITEVLCADEEVIVTYLRSHDYLEDTFINTDLESERDFIVPVSQIVMKLPKPNTHRRGKHFFFTSKINLKNIKL